MTLQQLEAAIDARVLAAGEKMETMTVQELGKHVSDLNEQYRLIQAELKTARYIYLRRYLATPPGDWPKDEAFPF